MLTYAVQYLVFHLHFTIIQYVKVDLHFTINQ